MTDEEKIKEMWELLYVAHRMRDLRPKPSFLDSVLKITEIVLCWAFAVLSCSITAYLLTELIPGFSDWLRML